MASAAPHHPDRLSERILNVREDIDRVEGGLLAAMERHGYADRSRFAVRLALEEALVNAFRHGHKNLPPDEPVLVEYRVSADRVFLAVEDRGPGFTPEAVPDPTLDENLEVPTGRGLLLIRSFMTSVAYIGRGNRVEITYERPA